MATLICLLCVTILCQLKEKQRRCRNSTKPLVQDVTCYGLTPFTFKEIVVMTHTHIYIEIYVYLQLRPLKTAQPVLDYKYAINGK